MSFFQSRKNAAFSCMKCKRFFSTVLYYWICIKNINTMQNDDTEATIIILSIVTIERPLFLPFDFPI